MSEMENVIISTFNEEAPIYEVISKLKRNSNSLNIIAAGAIKNNNNSLEIKDGFDFSDDDDNWAFGGLIGSIIGLIGGPIGLLLGSGLGISIGSLVDIDQERTQKSIFDSISKCIKPGKSAVIIVANEEDREFIDDFLKKFTSEEIIRESYLDVQAEIYEHRDLEKKLAKEARRKKELKQREKWHAMAEAKEKELADQWKRLQKK